jgi:hypothetical protein
MRQLSGTHYGHADIAPEEPARHNVERSWLAGTGLLLLAADFVLVYATTVVDQIVPSAGLAAGVLVEARRAWWTLKPGLGAALESELRGQYILYLRNFHGARASVAIATLMAAQPFKMVMVVSPRRIESRSVLWYVLSMLRPLVFDHVRLWSTIDAEWDRVVASCMARSRGMVIDCAGVSPNLFSNEGLTLEMGISIAFASEHPTAYAISLDQSLPMPLPLPAVLKVGSGLTWYLRYHRRLVQRLRAVLTRTLSEDENRYLSAYYSCIEQGYKEAVVRDRNLASREGREDPGHHLLLRRESPPARAAR